MLEDGMEPEAFVLKALDEGKQFAWRIPTWRGEAMCQALREVERLMVEISEGTMIVDYSADHELGEFYIGAKHVSRQFE